MADIVSDGRTRAYWVTTIANQPAPTTTELNAGIDLTLTLTADGLMGLQPDTATVDTSSLASVYNTAVPGRVSFSNVRLRLKRQTATDTIFNTLTLNTTGFLVVRRSITYSTAWASTQAIEVYPAICGETARVDPEPNTVERYEIPLIINVAATVRGAVA